MTACACSCDGLRDGELRHEEDNTRPPTTSADEPEDGEREQERGGQRYGTPDDEQCCRPRHITIEPGRTKDVTWRMRCRSS